MITTAQLADLKEGTPISYGSFGHVFFARVATHKDDGTPYSQNHVVMRDRHGNEKLVFEWLFLKHAAVLSE